MFAALESKKCRFKTIFTTPVLLGLMIGAERNYMLFIVTREVESYLTQRGKEGSTRQ